MISKSVLFETWYYIILIKPYDYNLETIKTINDARRRIDVKKFSSVDEMFEKLDKD